MIEHQFFTLVRCASAPKDLTALSSFIEAGFNINTPGAGGETALMIACRYNQHPFITRFLLQNGADVSFRNHQGDTAMTRLGLSPASLKAIGINIKNLIKYGADINEINNFKQSALHKTLFNSTNPKIADIFLKNGANPHLKDSNGISFFIKICQSAHSPSVIKQCLTQFSCPPEALHFILLNKDLLRFQNGWCPSNFEKLICDLIRKGANINHQDNLGMTPIMQLCQQNINKIKTNSQISFLEKITTSANLSNIAQIIKILIQNGARTSIQNAKGQNIFEICSSNPILMSALKKQS